MVSNQEKIETLISTKKYLIKKIEDMNKQIRVIEFQIKDIESSQQEVNKYGK